MYPAGICPLNTSEVGRCKQRRRGRVGLRVIMLSIDDQVLVEAARTIIRRRFRQGWHVVGAALRTSEGQIFTGVHLEANVGRIAVCAEAVALGRAITEVGRVDIDTIVAVYHSDPARPEHEIKIVAPCGMCREMISDYSPHARGLIPSENLSAIAVSIQELIPHKFARP